MSRDPKIAFGIIAVGQNMSWYRWACSWGILVVGIMALAPSATGGDILVPSGGYERIYDANLRGTVNGRPFDGARVRIRLAPSSLGDANPYLVIVEGLPERNAKNSFFWRSTDTTMNVSERTIICKTKASYTRKQPDVHFFYVSPVLLQIEHMTQQEEENVELAEQTALPTKIYALTGELQLTFSANRVSGTVRISGYDFRENAYATYSGSFVGQAYGLSKPKIEKLKNIGSFLVEPGGE